MIAAVTVAIVGEGSRGKYLLRKAVYWRGEALSADVIVFPSVQGFRGRSGIVQIHIIWGLNFAGPWDVDYMYSVPYRPVAETLFTAPFIESRAMNL